MSTLLSSLLALVMAAIAPIPTHAQVFLSPVGPNALARPGFGTVVRLELAALNALLDNCPLEGSGKPGTPLRDYGLPLAIPNPTGGLVECFAAASPVMEPTLQARYPGIRTFLLQSADGTATGRMEVSPRGLTAMLRTRDGAWMIDAWPPGDPTHVVSYWLRDRHDANDWTCHTLEGVHGFGTPPRENESADGVNDRGPLPAYQTLRTVRLAVACTGEYGVHQSQLRGNAPNAADPLAAIVTVVSRVNVVFEGDLGVHFNLVANNDQIVHFDPATDPYPDACDGSGGSNCSGPYLSANINALASRIGNANFDVGHLLTRVYGGVAFLSSVCGNNKAGGVSGIPRGGDDDALSFLIVIHELGHQFGGTHTFSGTRGRCAGNVTLSTAWEAGSGSSPLAYAGGCPVGDAAPSDNVAIFADPYFHHGSLGQMNTFLGNATCPVQSVSSNKAPVIESSTGDHAIPPGTPFVLSVAAIDSDGDALTHSWEQFDSGAARPLSGMGSADSGVGSLFRVFPPVLETTRTFPRMADVLSGVATPGEQLPQVAGVVRRFRAVVRDNHAGIGATTTTPFTNIAIAAGASPFTVLSPAPGATLGGGPHAVAWTVGGTDAPPISCGSVTIRLSTDGGATFPDTLGSFDNNGSATVMLPINIAAARVRIDADGNVFFAVSGSFVVVRCAADFNGTGGVSVEDIFDYLAAYFSGDPRSDFNGEGGVSVQDVFDFLSAYFSACP